jgi:hypothetical protein
MVKSITMKNPQGRIYHERCYSFSRTYLLLGSLSPCSGLDLASAHLHLLFTAATRWPVATDRFVPLQ